MVGNLRLNHERRLVDLNIASWNQSAYWLRQVAELRSSFAALPSAS
jgi:hypothetical protein